MVCSADVSNDEFQDLSKQKMVFKYGSPSSGGEGMRRQLCFEFTWTGVFSEMDTIESALLLSVLFIF